MLTFELQRVFILLCWKMEPRCRQANNRKVRAVCQRERERALRRKIPARSVWRLLRVQETGRRHAHVPAPISRVVACRGKTFLASGLLLHAQRQGAVVAAYMDMYMDRHSPPSVDTNTRFPSPWVFCLRACPPAAAPALVAEAKRSVEGARRPFPLLHKARPNLAELPEFWLHLCPKPAPLSG